MKKIIFALLLIALVASTGCTCGTSSSCTSCTCGCTVPAPAPAPTCNEPCVITPPDCLIPDIEAPCVCPPQTCTPDCDVQTIDIPTLEVPQVVCPPDVEPCDVYIPPPVIPEPCDPTPPPVEDPHCILPPLPPTYCPPPPPPCDSPCGTCTTTSGPLSNKFNLQLKYAARQYQPFATCQANVIWNGQIVASLAPQNYQIQLLNIIVFAKKGQNKLEIVGTGHSDSYGLIIDNAKLIRSGNGENIVINGGFEQPHVGHSWGIFNNIPGWNGQGIEIGWGNIYYSGWYSQVCELDGHANYQISQSWSLDSYYKVVSGNTCSISSSQTLAYKLQFQYAARKNGVSSAATSKGVAIWNGVVVASMNPTDYSIHTHTVIVQLKAGENVLEFDAAGSSDSYGLNIDNVKLYASWNSTNLIVNGNFETPELGGANKWNYFNGGIFGWEAMKAEVGHCQTVYNGYWSAANDQCIELDSDSNQRYTQRINISPFCFTNLIIQKKAIEGSQMIQNQLTCATAQAEQLIDDTIAKLEGDIYCQIQMTVSKFNQYICDLYNVNEAKIKYLEDNAQLVISQYDCLCDAWKHDFGCTNEPDFDDNCFDHNHMEHGECTIDHIHGKNIHCHDHHGHKHHLQVAPCSHFEGQWKKPKIGKKLFFKGKKQPCGRFYVKWATNCDC